MSDLPASATTLAHILGRTPHGQVLQPKQWELLAQEIIAIAKASGGLLTISGDVGCGKTTFSKMLTNIGASHIDIIAVSPASQIREPGWLLKAITPWLSSESNDTKAIQKKLSGLADTERSILIVVDGGDFIADELLSGDVASILNLSDHAGVKLTVVVLAAQEKLIRILADHRLTGKILMHRPLPSLQTNQIIELLNYKRSVTAISKLSINQADLVKIAEQSAGNPLKALSLLARKLGVDVVENPYATDQTKRLKPSLRQRQPVGDPIDLEDLLTPKNNGNRQK